MQPLVNAIGPVQTGVLIVTVIVIVYLLAKAVMRRIENKKDKEEHGGRF
ncbi:hypothetical protein [Polluticoccus soli]|nr:hypothetical protein [Flavipsychrobacter sp. JY13-12]